MIVCGKYWEIRDDFPWLKMKEYVGKSRWITVMVAELENTNIYIKIHLQEAFWVPIIIPNWSIPTSED